MIERTTRLGICAVLLAGFAALAPTLHAAEPQIEFLGVEAAKAAIVDDTGEPYFELLQPLEMTAKSGSPLTGDLATQRRDFRERYRGAVREFDEAEKTMLREGINRVSPYLADHWPAVADVRFSLIKVTEGVESGLPHTRGGHIVLSEPFLAWFGSIEPKRRDPMLADVLIHELVHVVQRAHPEVFGPLYMAWDFRRVDAIVGDGWFVEHQVINPDEPRRWICRLPEGNGTRWIWPTLILEPPQSGSPFDLRRNMRMIAVAVEQQGDRFAIRTDSAGQPVYRDLTKDDAYALAFAFANPTDRYGPGEISASAIADLLVDALFQRGGKDLPGDARIEALQRWIAHNFRKVAGQ
jgi:hypothetical protein